MGRFNAKTWNPKLDSTPGVDYKSLKLDPDTTIVLDTPTQASCLCGCQGLPTGKKSKFAMGHDARLKGRLIRAHLTGTQVAYITPNRSTEVSSAMDVASRHSWQGYLNAAQRKQGEAVSKATSTKPKAEAKPEAEAVKVKIGRWTYDGVITKVQGDTVEVEYKTKSGEVKTATVKRSAIV